MSSSISDAVPGSLRRWILTCFVGLLLLPLPPNIGYIEDNTQPVCGTPWWLDNSERKHHWPWQVSLRSENDHVCGGALIDLTWVVSAAHCIQGNKEYSVILGSHKLQAPALSWILKIHVGDIIVHPKYWGGRLIRSDIALLRLRTPVTFSKYVQPICILDHDFNLEVGSQCWVTGWGQGKQQPSANRTLTPELQETKVFILDNKKCDRVLHKKSFYLKVTHFIQRSLICATSYGNSSCSGDRGGPLACEVDGRWILAGVLSWEKDCIKGQSAGVYTRLSRYSTWMKEQMSHGAVLGPCRASWLLFLFWLLQLPVGP
ncbi:inactive serine protease 45-like [Acomys russatus]|uniref:inactive serine protease 45-like n=1 Tax=Acomys russatus TaxID=60746 RepID=UPI0021E1E19F|nr:inactive serine protease 45-like [Acomys russatus]